MLTGDKIKALRKDKGMTQEAVAEALGVTRQAVAKWESNLSYPSTSNIMKLAELFQVQFMELLSHEENSSSDILQNYIIKIAQAEEKREEKNKKIKSIVSTCLLISLCYVALCFLFWGANYLFGALPHIFWWSKSHQYIFVLAYIYSLAGSLFYRRRLGLYTFGGIVVGIIAGEIVGEITSNRDFIRFNHGWIALLACIAVFSLCGIVVSIMRIEKGKESAPLNLTKKARRIIMGILVFLLSIFIIIGAHFSINDIGRYRGALVGYNVGYEKGVDDKKNGLPFGTSQPYSEAEKYNFNFSEEKGFFQYWNTGYQDGYEKGYK